MWKRQKTGSVICPACGNLVGVRDKNCFHCGRWNPSIWGFGPAVRFFAEDFSFSQIVLWGCSILYIATLAVGIGNTPPQSGFSFFSPSNKVLFLFGSSGAAPVFVYGRWWTVLSAAWLHGNLIHILFNMMWVRQLVPATAELFGQSRLVILYTVSSITGFLLTSFAGAFLGFLPIPFLRGASFTVGASAPIFGLLGALVYYGRRVGSSFLGRQAWTFAVILFLFGLFLPFVDNYAHLGGFLGGYAASEWLGPERPERLNHHLLALICVAATFLSIAVSVVLGLKQFASG
ncbi:MAG: rhomboid family intramembrane serine protease [Acidobacteria bacterium]|nr:rhomboid family intramembrane serine protease [Acidobacteriota bacterium]